MTRGDTISMGVSIPGFCLPLTAVMATVGAGVLLGLPGGWLVVIAIVAVVGGVLPQTAGIWVAAAALVVALLSEPPDLGRTALAVAVVHLLHVVATLSLVVPLSALVALRALRPTGIRFVIIQAVAQGLALAVGLLPTVRSALPVAVIAGAAAVLAIALVAVRMMRARRLATYRQRPDVTR